MPKKSRSHSLRRDRSSTLFQLSRSYMGLLYGALTVVILFVIIFFGLRAIGQRSGTINEQGAQTSVEETPPASGSYTVKEGDSLWSIAENRYNDGYKWAEIARVNNLTNPEEIIAGTKLTMPAIAAATPAVPTVGQQIPAGEQDIAGSSKISGSSYVVVEGDNLWDIAVRAYGDGFKWTEIAKANNLENPDLIFPGNKFLLPR